MTLNELLSNETLVRELFSKGTPEDAQAFAKSKGVEVTVDELKGLAAYLKQKQGAELSSDELDTVAGGFGDFFQTLPGIFKLFETPKHLLDPSFKLFDWNI